jgi:hypothetical protein
MEYSSATCASGQSDGQQLGGGVSNASVAILDHATSLATISYSNSLPQTVHVSGDVMFTGGCERVSCGISFNYMVFTPDNFTLTYARTTTQVTSIVVANDGVMVGSELANYFSIPSTQIKVLVNAVTNGVHQTLEYVPAQNLSGYYSPSTAEFRLSGHFYSTSGTAADLQLDLHGEATSRPPVANAGADLRAYADLLGGATVTLNGSGSYDLDNDLAEIRWYEGRTYLGSGTTKAVRFSRGTHTVTAEAIDTMGKWSKDTATVTIM